MQVRGRTGLADRMAEPPRRDEQQIAVRQQAGADIIEGSVGQLLQTGAVGVDPPEMPVGFAFRPVREPERACIVGHIHVVDAAIRVPEDDLRRLFGMGRIDDANVAAGNAGLRRPQVLADGGWSAQGLPRDQRDFRQLANCERFRPSPVLRLQADAAHSQRSGRFQLDRQPTVANGVPREGDTVGKGDPLPPLKLGGRITPSPRYSGERVGVRGRRANSEVVLRPRLRGEHELQRLPGAGRCGQLGFCQDRSLIALGRQEHLGRLIATQPERACIRLAGHPRNSLAADPAVLETGFALAPDERQPLTLTRESGVGWLDCELGAHCTAANRPPAAADALFVRRALAAQRDCPRRAVGLDPQVTEPGLALPGPQADRAGRQRMLLILVDQHGLTADLDLQRLFGHPHHQREPLVDRHRAGHVLEVLEILAMPSQTQILAARVQGDLVALEAVGADSRLADLHDQARIPAAGIR